MILDQTRYEAFWRNPEKYRIEYELNLRPKALDYGLSRGLAFHIIAEESAMGKSKEEIEARLAEEGLSGKAVAVAWQLYAEYARRYPQGEVVLVEQEFIAPIPGSPHSMAGRIDQILPRNGELWVGELKTANAKRSYDAITEEWKTKRQADFEIIGARHLGHDVKGVWVRVVVEGTPPKVYEVEARRSEQQLRLTQLSVHQTCEIITLMRDTFGINTPWPHHTLNWPCSTSGKCEFEGICQQAFENLTPADLEGFKPREEHLECLKACEMAL